MVGKIGFTFLFSWATLFAVIQPADSPSPAASLCWVFCLCLRELVGPAGLCAQVLGRRCRCGPWQAIRPLMSQSSSCVLGTRKRWLQPLWLGSRVRAAGGSSRFWFVKLSRGFVRGARSLRIQPPWARVSQAGGAALGLNCTVLGSEVLGLWVEQLTSAAVALGGFRCWRPSGVSCVCPQFANRVRATGSQVSARAAYLALAVLGQRGEGRQGPRLLLRVL